MNAETKRVYEVIDNVGDERHPYALIDRTVDAETGEPSDEIVRVDVKPRYLADYAHERLNADRVIYDGAFLLREHDRSQR